MKKVMSFLLILLLVIILESTLAAQGEIVPGIVITRDNLDEYLPELKRLLPLPVQTTYLYGLKEGWVTMPIKEYEPMPLSHFAKVGLSNARKNFAVGQDNSFIGKWEAAPPFPHPKTPSELAWSIYRRRSYYDQQKWPGNFYLFHQKGTLERSFAWLENKRYWNGRCYIDPMPEEIGNNNELESKEAMVVTKPFDVKGFCQLRIRYEDIRTPDDVYSYLPALRRVRRLTGSDVTDPLLGSDAIMDDYEVWRRKINSKMTFEMKEGRFLQPVYATDKVKPPYDPLKHRYCYQIDWAITPVWELTVYPNEPNYPTSKRIMWSEKDRGSFILFCGVSYDRKGRPYRGTSLCHLASRKDDWGELWGFWAYSYLNLLTGHHTVLDLPKPQDQDVPHELFTFKGLLRRAR